MTTSDAPATTRGDLLRRAADSRASAARSLTSLRRVLPVVGWSVGLAVAGIAGFGADDSGLGGFALVGSLALAWWIVARLVPGRWFVGQLVAAVVSVVVGALLLPVSEDVSATTAAAWFWAVTALAGAGTAWSTWRYANVGRGLIDEIAAADHLVREPAGRALADTDVTPDVATIHDLRDRADFDTVAADVVGRQTAGLYGFAPAKPVVALMIPGLVGLVLTLGPLLGLGDAARPAATVVAGLVLLAPWAWTWIDLLRLQAARQGAVDRAGVEAHLYAVRRHHTSRVDLPTRGRASLLGTPAGATLLVGWLLLLVTRLTTSSALALGIAAGIVLALTAGLGARAVVLSRQVRVFPLAGRGDSVLQQPARRVALTLTDEALTITDAAGRAEPHAVPIDQVLAVEPVTGLSALSRRGVGIVTTTDPIVLSGARTTDHPAIVALRQRLDPA